jgi:hypothetical protein
MSASKELFTKLREQETNEELIKEMEEGVALLEQRYGVELQTINKKTMFIPETVEIPSGGGGRYTKVKEGETLKLRIISETITEGYVGWTNEPKPVRWRKSEEMPNRSDWKADDRPKYFWVVTLFNHNTSQIEIWEITQKSIMESLKSYSKDEDYGHPKGYDLKVTRKGKGLETTYDVIASPPKAVADEVHAAILGCRPDIDALFTGEDPFKNCK